MSDAIGRGIVVHGGAGSPPSMSDGCRQAAEEALGVLGAGPLEAVIAAVVSMEDDGRFNAGSGSVLRLDGRTVEMDAAVMDSDGVLGAVAAIRSVKNPVLVARRVAETPHVLLAGPGGTAFARAQGFGEHAAVSDRVRARHDAAMRALREGRPPAGWESFDIAAAWNFEADCPEAMAAHDTVGAVAVTEDGRCAVAGSTGGSTPMLLGRVGDTPLPGAGFYAGRHGAVAATGDGEQIIRAMLAFEVYRRMADGLDPQSASDAGLAAVPEGVLCGLIAISPRGYGVASSAPMASYAAVD